MRFRPRAVPTTLPPVLGFLLLAGCGAAPAPPPESERGPVAAPESPPAGMVRVPAAGVRGPDGEVQVGAFDLDIHEVTNREFAAFVDATGFVTEAENWGWSLVFHPEPTDSPDLERRPGAAPWWLAVDGAWWREPGGPESEALPEHPVVHVSWNDAAAYCAWRDKRLPTEAEWDLAAAAGGDGGGDGGGALYPWGDDPTVDGQWQANVWQGPFPARDEATDGHDYLAPVGAYPPNALGIHDLGGNVWEWIDAWYVPGRSGGDRLLKGGSWLCSVTYCEGYRNSNRNNSAPDSGLDNTGMRCARSLAQPDGRLSASR